MADLQIDYKPKYAQSIKCDRLACFVNFLGTENDGRNIHFNKLIKSDINIDGTITNLHTEYLKLKKEIEFIHGTPVMFFNIDRNNFFHIYFYDFTEINGSFDYVAKKIKEIDQNYNEEDLFIFFDTSKKHLEKANKALD